MVLKLICFYFGWEKDRSVRVCLCVCVSVCVCVCVYVSVLYPIIPEFCLGRTLCSIPILMLLGEARVVTVLNISVSKNNFPFCGLYVSFIALFMSG